MTDQLALFSPINQKRIEKHFERREKPLATSDIGYQYSTLTGCFLPYRDPGVRSWEHRNGKYSLIISAGAIRSPDNSGELLELGLPFGPKPRLFLAFINSLAVKRQSPVVPVGRSMTAMLKELGFQPNGGLKGTVHSFKKQIMRLAASHFVVAGPGPKGGELYTKASPIRQFNVWLPLTNSKNIWPREIVLTEEYFRALLDHAVPYDVRALQSLQNNARGMDIFLWFSQRLTRLNKPLHMKWPDLIELFGGNLAPTSNRAFKRIFRRDSFGARIAFGECRMEETRAGFLFYPATSPVPRR